MTCGRCPEGRKFAEGSVNCIYYGMIIRAGHICTRERGRWHDAAGDHGERGEGQAEIQEDSRGAAGAVPGVLSGSGKREGVPGMEGREGRTE